MMERPNHLRLVRHMLVDPPADHPKRFTIYTSKPDLFQALARNERRVLRGADFPLTFGERLVQFFHGNGELFVGILIGIAIGSLAVCAAAYVIRWTVLS